MMSVIKCIQAHVSKGLEQRSHSAPPQAYPHPIPTNQINNDTYVYSSNSQKAPMPILFLFFPTGHIYPSLSPNTSFSLILLRFPPFSFALCLLFL